MVLADKGRWTRKPLSAENAEIDRSHPLARGLNGYYLLNEGGANVNNLARPRYRGALTAGAIWGATERGVGVFFGNGADDNILITTPSELLLANNFTWCVRVFFRAANAIQTVLEQANPGYFIRMDAAGGAVFGRTGVAADLTVANQFTANAWYDFGLTLGSTTARIYINGIDVGNVAFTSVTPTGNMRISSQGGSTRAVNGFILFSQMYNRELSAPEMKLLSAEPYAFLRPVLRRTYFVSGGVVAPTLPQLERFQPRGILRGVFAR